MTQPLPHTPTPKKKRWNITNWQPKHDRILELYISGNHKSSDLAPQVSLSTVTLDRILASLEFKRRLSLIQTNIYTRIIEKRSGTGEFDTSHQARELLCRESLQAAKILVGLMNHGETDRIKMDASREVLERAGVIAPKITEQKTHERVYAPEEVLKAKVILLESQEIVARLTTTPSPFVIGDTISRELESSVTDKAHNDSAVPAISTDQT